MKISSLTANLALGLLLVTIVPSSIAAAPAEQTAQQNKQRRGQTGGSPSGGGTYGACEQVQTPLTALVPYRIVEAQPAPITYVGGVTTSASPTLWFYVPYQPRPDLTASFVLRDAEGNIDHQTTVDLTTAQLDGIVSVSVPNLEIGQLYRWYFKVNCEAENLESPIYVNGGIERIPLEPQLAAQLAQLSPLEQVELYRQRQIWYDALTILGNLRRERPTDAGLKADWDRLLESRNTAF